MPQFMTKGKAFFLCFLAVLFIYASMFILGVAKGDLSIIPVSQCLTALGALAGTYLTLSVANNGVKGKCFNAEMYDRENPKEESK